MDTEELIRKCKAITIKEKEKNRVTLVVRMKEKKEKVFSWLFDGQDTSYERSS